MYFIVPLQKHNSNFSVTQHLSLPAECVQEIALSGDHLFISHHSLIGTHQIIEINQVSDLIGKVS